MATRLAVDREQRRDAVRYRLGQRHLDEDQRRVGKRGMEEGVAAAVDGIDAAAQIVPVADFMHGLVADDLFENVRRRRPVDPAQHEKPPVEPRGEQMRHVVIDRGEILAAVHVREQIGAHGDEIAGAVRRAVEAADQFLPPRLGGEMHQRCHCRRRAAPARPRSPSRACARSGPKSRASASKKATPAGGVELVVAVEHLARHRRARGLAAARQQRFAQFDQVGGVLLAVGGFATAQQAAAALGNGRQQVGEEGVGHGSV